MMETWRNRLRQILVPFAILQVAVRVMVCSTVFIVRTKMLS